MSYRFFLEVARLRRSAVDYTPRSGVAVVVSFCFPPVYLFAKETCAGREREAWLALRVGA